MQNHTPNNTLRKMVDDIDGDTNAILAMLEYVLPELNRKNKLSAYFVTLAISAILKPDIEDYCDIAIRMKSPNRIQ